MTGSSAASSYTGCCRALPELPIEEREIAARRFLALPTHRLTAEEQDEIRRETLAVLDHPDFAALFGPGSQAEVPLVGLIGGHALSGRSIGWWSQRTAC